MSLKENDHYNETMREYKSELEALLNDLKDKKLPSKTTFGDLQYLVPVPYSKFYNMENPRPRLTYFYNQQESKIDYQREFSANTRTDLAKNLLVDELNFQHGRE